MALLGLIAATLAGVTLGVTPTPTPCGAPGALKLVGEALVELEDPGRTLTLAQVRAPDASSRWQPPRGQVPSHGYTGSAYWFRFTLVNDTAAAQRCVVEYAWPMMREVDVFALAPGAETPLLAVSAGSSRPRAPRPFDYRHLAVPLSLAPGERAEVLTRVLSDGPLQLPVRVHGADTFPRVMLDSQMVWGLFFGFMLLIAFYNLVLFVSLRETSHLYLTLFIVFLCGLQSTFNGHTSETFFGATPSLNMFTMPLFLNGTVLFGVLFTMRFLRLREHARGFHLFFVGMAVCAGLTLLVLPALSLRAASGVGNLLVVPTCVGAIAAGGALSTKGFGSARIYTAAWTLFLIGATALALNKLGLLPHNDLTEYGWTFGAMIKAVLLTVAMGYSIDKLKRQREEVQRQVDERTTELAEQTTAAERAREEAIEARGESEQLRAEAERYATQLEVLDKQKTTFFTNISHELRTPLTLILNPLDEEARDRPGNHNLEVATKNARRLLRLVNQLLDFQKLEAGKKELQLEPINLVYFVHISGSYFHSACASKEIDFRVTLNGEALTEDSVAGDPIFIQGESDALEKVAFNFLSNALKYTPRGGVIELGLAIEGGRARLFVRDSGPGISEEDQRGLFRIFSQVGEQSRREYEGTGLGLALVKELTELMRGEVGVQSAPGAGSTFWSDFELRQIEAPARRETAPSFHIREWLLDAGKGATDDDTGDDSTIELELGPGQVVLVVDDLADMRVLISNTLKNRNYRILTAPDGARALELAQQHHPDLIITDWMMPVMDGPQLIEALKGSDELASIPVVLLTARSDEESKLLGTEVGADAFIGKPFNELELVSVVRNLIQLKAREHEVEDLNRLLVENVLKRYLPPDLVEQFLSGDKRFEQEPKSAAATVLFSDLSGFTALSSNIRAARMARVLNEYLTEMTDVIFDHGGTIDKFIGDAIMVLFGAPVPLEPDEQATRAVRCALAMQTAMAALNRKWVAEGLSEFKMRIGVHHGAVVVGSFGSDKRSDYTAIGPTVNLASRIEAACAPGEIYISGELYDFLPEDQAELAGEFELKGVEGKRHLYRLRVT